MSLGWTPDSTGGSQLNYLPLSKAPYVTNLKRNAVVGGRSKRKLGISKRKKNETCYKIKRKAHIEGIIPLLIILSLSIFFTVFFSIATKKLKTNEIVQLKIVTLNFDYTFYCSNIIHQSNRVA